MLKSAALSPEKRHARAKNAVAQFLFRALIVPKIFFDARWPLGKSTVDVLAVDRAGAGEIHVAEVKATPGDILKAVQPLMEIPAHFRYLALFSSASFIPSVDKLYAPDGMGRIGIIQVREDGSGDLSAQFLIRPERFRLNPSFFKRIDKFTATRPADIEIRP